MKMLFTATVAAAMLSACSQKTETTVEPTATETVATTPTATGAATGDMAGKYEMTMADGTVATETISSDGSYTMVSAGKETKGKWRMDGARSCFDPDGDGAEVCYKSTAPGADGSFTATGPDGSTMTVRKVGAAPTM